MDALKSQVYVLPNAAGYITRIDGGYTATNITNPENWVLIDEGTGDRYNLCQSNYLPQPLRTDGGAYRYKLVDGQVVECTAEEIAAQEEAMSPNPDATPTLEYRVGALETDAAETREALEMILTGVTE